MARPIADVVGLIFGPWTVTERVARQASGGGGGSWLVAIRCNDCGKIRTASVRHLRKRPPCCVCQPPPPRPRTSKWSNNHGEVVHGHSVRGAYSPEYLCWRGIKQRCENPMKNSYQYYGARGVRVCEEWRTNFLAFFEHIGPKPSPEHSIDRIDVNGNYEPGNVRWATRIEQANNKRPRSSVGASCG